MYMKFTLLICFLLLIILIMLVFVADFDFLYPKEGVTNLDTLEQQIAANEYEIIETNDKVYKTFSN